MMPTHLVLYAVQQATNNGDLHMCISPWCVKGAREDELRDYFPVALCNSLSHIEGHR